MKPRVLATSPSLILAVFLAALVIALGSVSFQRKLERFQPLGFEFQEISNQFQVLRVTAPGSPLEPGDRVLLVNGREPVTEAGLRAELRRQPSSEVLVLRGQALQPLVVARPPLDIEFPYLILALISALYLAIGVYTLLRDRRREALLFFLWCLVSATVYLLSPTGLSDLAGRAIYLLEESARLLLAPLTLHLFLVFPVRSERNWVRRLTPFLYLPAAALLVLQADLAATGGRLFFGPPDASSLQALDRLEMIHLAAFGVLALGVLGGRLLQRKEWEARRQAQWIAVGLGAGYLPFLALYALPLIAGWRAPEWLTAGAVFPLALVPLTFAYAILRYKLWDMAVIVRDAAATTLTLLLGLLSFSLFSFVLGRGVPPELAVLRSVLSFAAGVVIASLMVPARRGIAHTLERFQYRGSFGHRRALASAGRDLLHERDLDRLAAGLLDQLVAGLSLERANLFLMQGDSMVPVRPEPGLPAAIAGDAFGDGFWQREVEGISGVAFPGAAPSAAQRLFMLGYRYAFPLVMRGSRVGVVALGYREEQAPLNSEDVDLVRGLLDQAALAIENAQLMDQLHRQVGELARLQQHTEGIIESSPAGLAVLDAAGYVRSANLAFAAIAGVPRPQAIGRQIAELLPVQPLPEPGADLVAVAYCDAEGEERHLQISVSRLDRGPFAAERLLMVQDSSERVAMEQALRERERLASLGMLAAGVAHEVNTPITGISSYAQMLLAETAPDDPRYELLKKVERQTFRAARIVNGLLEFARDRHTEMRPVALSALLAECADLLKERLHARSVRLSFERPADELLVAGDDGELQQVFTNLMVNAVDAMSAGGTLTLAAVRDHDRVRITVRDTGPGIPGNLAERIFQPFFSTKLGQGGTGLGLSISYNIVHRHGGEMRAENHPEGGACFTIELPLLPLESFRRQRRGRRRPRHRARRPRPLAPRRQMNILIVDDEEVLQDVLTSLIRRAGHSTISARSGEEALELLVREEVDLVLLDLMLPGMSGLQVLQEVRRRDPEQVVVVITAYSSIESAVDAMREGAFHYIPKPFKNEEVLLTLRRALEQRQLRSENRELKEQLHKRFGFDNIIGKSRPMQQVFELIRLAAPAKSNILILGESGTGKELVAKAIHHHSRRAEGAFVTVNSGSMPADLLESSLFGHVKGSFTGAIAHKRGLFELANGGSIFFDEIGNIPPDTQAKLLRVIQEREFMRVGGLETIRVDVRIIAATNADLESLVESGGFREDLYYRLNVITITLPPLRKRSEDIPLLVRHFLGHYAEENEKPLRDIAPRAMELLMDYHWPGNVRELENVIERAVVLSTGSQLDVDLLPTTVRQPGTFSLPTAVISANGGVPFKEAVGAYERQLIIKALKSAGGVQKRAAELLQVKPTTLHEMMKRLNISADSLAS